MKGTGAEEVARIAAGRPYASLQDFWERARPALPTAERLIRIGALDALRGLGVSALTWSEASAAMAGIDRPPGFWWQVYDAVATAERPPRADDLAAAAGGEVLALDVSGHREVDGRTLEQRYLDQREQEWTEFGADAGKFLAELDHEEAIGKLTLAELEEEEQTLERLRRWFRDLRGREQLGTASVTTAAEHLRRCERRLEEYAERVYAATGQG